MAQAAEASRTPIVSTHSCVSALCDHSRNMADWQLDVVHDVKGVIQITAVSAFLKPNAKPEDITVADFADHIDYAVKRIGIDHVGISSDFDGGGGFSDWRDASQSPNITIELVRRGYDRSALEKLWGGNFLRVMRVAERLADG
jgi:membrane dipeptidase